jgi:hypothetical protein
MKFSTIEAKEPYAFERREEGIENLTRRCRKPHAS